jgi:signal transduction histidine kinase
MGDLIGSLVEYSRVNSAPLNMTDVELESLLDEALEEVRPWTSGRSIQWQRSRLPVVRGDAGLLRQVLVNLLSNAVKFTRQRELAVIEIGAHQTDDGWSVFVRDNGVVST